MKRRSKNRNQQRGRMRGAVWLALCVLVGLSACSMDAMDAAGSGYENEDAAPGDMAKLHEAEAQLENHRVDEARSLYEAHLESYPGNGSAAAGVGITDLLLVAESDEMTELIVDYLEASSGLDANALLYAEGGYLYWRSRGARWIDDGQSGQGHGVLSLLEDELPWPMERLASLDAFVEGLDEPVKPLIRQLRIVTTGLKSIDEHLETAIGDAGFNRLYIPGEVFHDTDLAMQLGRGELSMLRAVIAFATSAVYFLEAYEQEWTLEKALGPWRLNVGLDHPRYIPGFGATDYTVDYLDEHLLREVTNPDRLSASRLALRDGIAHLREALHHGVEQSYSTTLLWGELDEDEAYEMDLFLEALSDALDSPTTLPHADDITLDLSPLFEDGGRSLDEDIDWFVRRADAEEPLDGAETLDELRTHWTVNEDALYAFALEGVVEPLPEDDAELARLAGPGDGVKKFVQLLISDYWKKVEDVYFQTR